MGLPSCLKCGAWCYADSAHRCDPAWKVWQPDLGQTIDDARSFYSMSPEKAVEKWAEWSDRHSADYDIVGGSPAIVLVVYADEDAERAEFLRLPTDQMTFEVYGESVPEYTAVRRSPHVPHGKVEK